MRASPSTNTSRSGWALALAARIWKKVSSRHSPAARQRRASSGLSTVSNCMRVLTVPMRFASVQRPCSDCAVYADFGQEPLGVFVEHFVQDLRWIRLRAPVIDEPLVGEEGI